MKKTEQRGQTDQRQPTNQEPVHMMGAQIVHAVAIVMAPHGIVESPAAGSPFGTHLITELMPSLVPGATIAASTAMATTFGACFLFRTVLFVDGELLPHTDTKFGHGILHCLL
jgi:hypothetical protein